MSPPCSSQTMSVLALRHLPQRWLVHQSSRSVCSVREAHPTRTDVTERFTNAPLCGKSHQWPKPGLMADIILKANHKFSPFEFFRVQYSPNTPIIPALGVNARLLTHSPTALVPRNGVLDQAGQLPENLEFTGAH